MLKSGFPDDLSFDHNAFNDMYEAVDLLVEEGAAFLLSGDDNIIASVDEYSEVYAALQKVRAFLSNNEQDRIGLIKGLVRIMVIKHSC